MDGVACNGWRFWSVEGTLPERAKKTNAEKPATKKAPAKKAGKGKKAAKKGKAQREVAKGDSFGCGACGETFPSMKAATKHALTHTTA